MFAAILQTKLYLPPPRPDWVERSRLLDQLAIAPQTKLILVSAPAGYGKTTLVTAWLRQLDGVQSCWLSLDEDDSDPRQFFHYLAAAIEPLPNIQSALTQFLQSTQPLPIRTLAKAFINDVTQVATPFCLVLDDYHAIDSADVDAALATLLALMPPQMTLLLTSRSDPGFPISRLRARGELIELRADDLRFTEAEAAQFLQQMMGLTLTTEQIAALESRTEGWIAGLQMAALSMRNRSNTDLDNFVHSFTGSHRFIMDYLAEEVFAQQSSEIQNFVLKTSILERFNAPLCDALLQQENSHFLLTQVENRNLFLIPLDDERYWFRYHHLFAEFFRMRLKANHADLLPQLHHRAAHWYAAQGLLNEAIIHAYKAEDHDQIAAWIVQSASLLMGQGEFSRLRSWLAYLPPERIYTDVALFMSQLWIETTLMSEERIEPDYNHAKTLIETSAELGQETQHNFLAQLLAMRMIHALSRYQPESARQFGEQALTMLPKDEARVRPEVLRQLGNVYRFHGDFSQAFAAFEETIERGLDNINRLTYFASHYHAARLLRKANRLFDAQALFEHTTSFADQIPEQSPLLSFALMEFAYLLLARGQLDEAVTQAQAALPLAELTGFPSAAAELHHLLSCIYVLQGQMALAQQQHDTMKRSLQANVHGGGDAVQVIQTLQFTRLQNDLDAMRRTLKRASLLEQLSSDLQFELKNEMSLTYLVLGQPELALDLIRELRGASTDSFGFLLLELHLVEGAAYQLMGQHAEALDALNKALALAVPQHHLWPFVLGGKPVQQLLQMAHGQMESHAKPFADQILAMWGTAVLPLQSSLVEPLSKRELEILALIAAGLKNKEIAEKLFISLNTVLHHNKNIYGKLDVNKRTLAIAKARELNLIP